MFNACQLSSSDACRERHLLAAEALVLSDLAETQPERSQPFVGEALNGHQSQFCDLTRQHQDV